MFQGYKIRLATESDLPLLPDIERQAGTRFAEYGLEQVMSEVLTPTESLQDGVHSGQLWVAVTSEDRPVGFALAGEVDGHAHLDELDVLPEHGRHGIGAALIEAVCSWGCSHGYRAITLTTLSNVPWNAPFYSRHGFRMLDPAELSEAQQAVLDEDVARGLPAENRVVMRREL